MILSGEKKEEYREIKFYWVKRLVDKEIWHGIEHFNRWRKNPPEHVTLNHVVNEFDFVKLTNGYSKNSPSLTTEWKGISIGKAKPEWSDNWQGDVFVIKLGNIIETKNIK